MARVCLAKAFLAPFNNTYTQKAFRYVILLPEIPSCNSTNNELLRFIEAGELPPFEKGIPFGDAIEGTAKLALEYEHTFAEHCVRMNDIHLMKNFSNVIEPLCKDQARLSYAWCTLRHLYSITQFKTQDAAVKAETRLAEIQRVVSRCLSSQYNNGAFHRAVKEVAADKHFLNFWQSKLCNHYLAEARLNGTGLDPVASRKLNTVRSKLENDMKVYNANVMRTATECTHYVQNASSLEDAPTSLLYEWAVDPNQCKKGPYIVSLSHKSYNAFMKYCRDRLLRYKYFIFWNNRAAFKEKSVYHNNSLVVDDIRLGRGDEANALGFKSFAEMSMLTKMARDLDEIESFLIQLRDKTKPKFLSRLNDMQLFAKKHEMIGDPLKPWDHYYYARKLIETATEFKQAEFSSCFPFFRTWRNLLALTEKMFGISYVDVSESVERWHDSVKVYSVRDSSGEERGLFYVDAFIRPGKLQSNRISHGRTKCQLNGYKPIVYLNINIMKGEKLEAVPISVEILLFLAKSLGDVMATMLCGSPYSSLSGVQSVELDASQFYAEVFKWIVLEPSILSRLSSDRLSVQDADIVREVYIESMLPILLREGFLSEFDMVMNHSSGRIFWRDIYSDLHEHYYDKKMDKMDNYPCSFTDVMLQRGSCGYYGQLWSEMLACDVVAAFREAGCFESDEKLMTIGKRYKETFLNQGGGMSMRKIFTSFRNRDLDFKHLFDSYKL